MEYMIKPVAYLDSSDFDDEGNIINKNIPQNDKPVFIMLQANFCGYCRMAKPDFQKFAENNVDKFFCASIQADSNEQLVKDLQPRLGKIYPNLFGFPSYIVYYKGKKVIYEGGRKLQDLQTFADGFNDYFNKICSTDPLPLDPLKAPEPTPTPTPM
jgi:thiol-disulfide isomerase/thioredoxin